MKSKITIVIGLILLCFIGAGYYFYCREGVKNMVKPSLSSQTEFKRAAAAFAGTDPEFNAFFGNFAFAETFSQSGLDAKTGMMVILAANIATQSLSEYKLLARDALDAGLSPIELKEILYQAVPYLGIGKVYDFLVAANDILTAKGVRLPLPEQSNTTPDNRFEKGLALQLSIFGERIENMRKNAPENQKHINDFLADNCFGDYYTRSGLDIKTRELLTFVLLSSLGGADNQVKGHIQGNINVGNNKQVLIDTLTLLVPFIGYPRTLNALAALNEVVPEK